MAEEVSSEKAFQVKVLQRAYGGIHTGKWVDQLPSSWIPFIQLSRLSPPAPLFLIYFPHLFGILYAATLRNCEIIELLRMCLYMLVASLFFSNAAHAWDDLVDAPIDKLIPRTQKRPIVRGAISPLAAFIFAATQAIIAASFLLGLPHSTGFYTIPTIIGTIYYPFAKRHMACPQLVLGFCLAWGTAVGVTSMGVDVVEDKAVLYIVAGGVVWTIIYDTVYASLDLQEDIKFGLGSTAVLFGSWTKFWLLFFISIMVASLGVAGWLSGFGMIYYIISLGGCFLSLTSMVVYVKLGDSASCWWWFTYGFWVTGMSIVAGLSSEYVLRYNSIGSVFTWPDMSK